MKNKDNIVYLYHVGKQKPLPRPCNHKIGILPEDLGRVFTVGNTESYKWYRSWLPEKKAKAGVFLTPDPYQLAYFDCIRGRIYQFAVPKQVVKACGGIHRAARIHEVLILPEYWPFCKLVSSKPLDEKKLRERRISERKDFFRLFPKKKKTVTKEAAQETLLKHNRKKKNLKRLWLYTSKKDER